MTKIDSSTWYYPSSPSTTIYLQKACTVICFDSSLLIRGAEIRAPRFRPILLDVYDYPISVHIVTFGGLTGKYINLLSHHFTRSILHAGRAST